jgi:hypothetical protein
MSENTIETINYKGLTIHVEYDELAENPRDGDNVAEFHCWHRRYTLGDFQHDGNESGNHVKAELLKKLRPKKGETFEDYFVCRPLYMYDHSGITISTSPFSCPWDSGQLGFIVVSRKKAVEATIADKKARKSWRSIPWDHKVKVGKTEITLQDWAYEIIKIETAIYDSYLTGEIAGVFVDDPEGDEPIFSCGGFLYEYPSFSWDEREFVRPYQEGIAEAEKAIDKWLADHGLLVYAPNLVTK